MSALELRDVVVDYEARGGGRVRAVAGASLTVEPGQIVGLVGESGCGKSSLARAAVGLVTPTAGSVLFEGAPVSPLTRRARPRELVRLQLVFQKPYSSLNPRRKVGAQPGDALDALHLVPRRGRAARVSARGWMAETGPTLPLWRVPLPPSGEALIAAVPHPDGTGFLPGALPGGVPDPANPPAGCRFHPRCPYVFDRCRTDDPPLVPLLGGRTAACWLQPEGAPVAPPSVRAANRTDGAVVQ